MRPAADELANKLYYGDNLGILRGFPAEVVDLVYLDPPFNSQRDYNVIFRDESGNRSDAQQLAFEDTWHWGPTVERHYAFLTNTARHRGKVPERASTIIAGLRSALGDNQMTAYLVEMAVRLVEMRRLLKPTGSLYLHCDPTASHYLKMLLDQIFGVRQFRNEIIWSYKRYTGYANRFQRLHDVILFYGKGEDTAFNDLREAYGSRSGKADSHYKQDDEGRWYRWQKRAGKEPYKLYLSEGRRLGDVWEMPIINASARERLGYPTQKPLALLERIISASSKPGDIVLDPFCGCGTALDAAQKLRRRWIGMDITYLAIGVVRRRMMARHPGLGEIAVDNRPTELAGARQMAAGDDGRYQFQWWALDEIGATPRGDERRKGADEGVDGLITFSDVGGVVRTVIVSVKSGHPQLDDVRVLRDTVTQRRAAMGILVTLEEPTAKMRQDAAAAGFWHSELYDRDYLRIQILSAADLIEKGKRPDLPPLVAGPYRVPGRAAAVAEEQEVWNREA